MDKKDLTSRSRPSPLPIWFFVGLVLVVYGVILVAGSFFIETPDRVVSVTSLHPGLWWGLGMAVFGLVFLWIGLRWRGS